MRSLLIFLFACQILLNVACDVTTPAPTPTPTSTEPNAPTEETRDWLCIPNERVGLITDRTTEAELKSAYGDANVVRREVGQGEGEMTMASVVFPETPNELIVEWQADFAFQRPQRIRVEQENTEWKTEEGITVGTTFVDLLRINGKDFNFYGFEWDYGGMVNDWDGGQINKQLVLTLFPGQPDAVFPDLLGDGTFSSAHPKASAADLKVGSMIIYFGL